MGRVSGDKSRYHRERRKRIARREQMRVLRTKLAAKGPATPRTKAGTVRERVPGSA